MGAKIEVGSKIEVYFNDENPNHTIYEIRGIVDDYFVVMSLKNNRYKLMDKHLTQLLKEDGNIRSIE